MTAAELALALLRTTLATSVAACLAAILLSVLRVDSPRTHRVVWLLVVLQGWLLFPWTLELAVPPQPAPLPLPGAMSSSSWTWTESTIATNLPGVAEPEPAASPLTPSQLALAAWLTGAALLALYAATRYIRVIRALPLGAPPDDPQWQDEWSSSLGAMLESGTTPGGTPKVFRRAWRTILGARHFNHALRRLARATQFRIHFRITRALGPLVAYIPFAYVLLAPRTLWATLTPAERTAILRHELAHVRRRDLWKSLAIRLLALLQWFNPLVWRAVRRFDEAAEWACDAAACQPAARGLAPDHTTLATALLRTAELTLSQTTPRAAGLVPAVPSGPTPKVRTQLQRRIHRLVTPRFKEESAMRKLAVPALLFALAAAQLIRIERVSADESPSSESEVQGQLADAVPAPADAPANHPAEAVTPPADPAVLQRRPYEEQAWPRYIIEPPDVLLINGVKLVPKSPHRLESFDVIIVRAAGAFPDQPIDDTYAVDADGTINLGPTYGRVKVVGLTLEDAEKEIQATLSKILTDVEASASLVASAGAQQVSGQHLVAMDGRVNLGVYGSVYVAGMTIEEARAAIEKKLAELLENPQVAVDVHAYNSKVYYIITKGGDKGDDVVRAPITGNDTVLDAIAGVGGGVRSDDVKIWIARPAPNGVRNEQILPVAWNDVASGTSDETNYTLQPGDRLFIDEPGKHDAKATHAAMGEAFGEPAEQPIHESDLPHHNQQVHPRLDAAGGAREATAAPDAAQSAPEASDLQVGDVITVLVDYPRDPGQPRLPVSQIDCRIKEIGPGGSLLIAGQTNRGSWNASASTFSLSGEVRHESIGPDRTVSIRSIMNLDIVNRLERPATPPSESAAPSITIVLRQNGGEQLMPQAFRQGMTVGDALRGAVYPNPINSSEALISLERKGRDGEPNEQIHWAPGWNPIESKSDDGDNSTREKLALRPSDRIVIDLSQNRQFRYGAAPRSTPDLVPAQATSEAQPSRSRYGYSGSANGRLLFERAADAPTAAQPPQPAGPAPAPRFAQQVMFKLSVVRDTSGDMAELGDSLREDGAATGDTESMLGVLRILRKHKLVEVVADPQVVTVLGRPASIAIEPQATGDAGKVTAVVAPVLVKDGVLRLEAGMSLGETRIDRGFDLPLGETLVIAAPPHDKVGPNKLYLVVTPELVDHPTPLPY